MTMTYSNWRNDLDKAAAEYRDIAPASLARMKVKFPTSGLAVIDFAQAAWPAIGSGGGYLERFVTPVQIGGEDD